MFVHRWSLFQQIDLALKVAACSFQNCETISMTFQELVSKVGKVQREGGRGLEGVGVGGQRTLCAAACGRAGMLTGVMTRSSGRM